MSHHHDALPPRIPFRFAVQPRPLDMSPEACRERLRSFERDPQCYRSRGQIEADRASVARHEQETRSGA